MVGQPPDMVPDGLTPEEYYSLGTWYNQSNKLNQARDALHRVIALQPTSALAANAQRFLGSKIPKNDVPAEAMQKYQALNLQRIGNPSEAENGYKQLIEQYPNFEWPYKALADIYQNRGDLPSAMTSLEKALEINPHYGSAIARLAFVHAADMEYDKAAQCLERGLAALPPATEEVTLGISEIDQLRHLRRTLEILRSLD